MATSGRLRPQSHDPDRRALRTGRLGLARLLVAARPDEKSRYDLATAYLKLSQADAARGEVRAALQSGRPFDQEPEARQLLRELGDTTR